MWGIDNATNIVTILLGIAGFALSIVSIRVPNLAAKVSLWSLATGLLLFLSFSVGGGVRTTQLTKANASLENDKTELSGQVRDLQIRVDSLQTRIEDLQQQINSLESNNSGALSAELETLRQENLELKTANDAATAEIAQLKEQLAELQRAGETPPKPSASRFTQQMEGVEFTLTEVTNDGDITFWFTALNEGQEDRFCLYYYNTNLFNDLGTQYGRSYFIINNSQEDGVCSYIVLPNQIPVRFGVAFAELPPETTSIPQLTLAFSSDLTIRFRDVPIPYIAASE